MTHPSRPLIGMNPLSETLRSAPSILRRPGVLLTLGAFVVYNLNFAHVGCADDITYRFLPLALLRHGTPTLDPYVQHLLSADGVLHWRLLLHEGHAVPIYPPATGIFALPVYAIPSLLWSSLPVLLLSKLSSSGMVAVSVGVMYATVRRMGGSARQGVVLACVFGFATPVYPMAAQSLCQHPAAVLMVSIALYATVRARREGAGWPTLAALGIGVAVAVRPQTAIVLTALGVYVLSLGRRELGAVVTAGAAPLIATLSYNVAFTGRILGGYGLAIAEFPDSTFGVPTWTALAGLLFSPGAGLFVFTPVALFGAAGAVRGIRRQDPLVMSSLVGIFATLLFSAGYNVWWGGGTYGPRYLVETMPLLVVLLVVAVRPPSLFTFRTALGVTFVILALLSTLIQAVGAFSPRCSWSYRPAGLTADRSRLWDWTDTPVTRCAAELKVGGDDLFEVVEPTEREGPVPSFSPPIYR